MLRANRIWLTLISFSLAFSGSNLLAQDQSQDSPLQEAQVSTPQTDTQGPVKTLPPQTPAEVVKPTETASSPSTLHKIGSNFWDDQKAIWSSPFHINHDNAKWWGIFGIGTLALIATDRTTERAIPYSVQQTSFSRNVSQIGQEYVTLPLAGGLYFYGRAKNDPKAREVGVLGVQALLDSEIAVTILKVAGGRERPNQIGGNGRFFHGRGLSSGFPSGHAIETWSFASVIAHEYAESKLIPIVAYGLAGAVSVARYTGQYHYPSDIVAGGAMGWFIGKFVWDHHQDPEIHKRYGGISKLMPKKVNPVLAPASHTYGVHLGWGN